MFGLKGKPGGAKPKAKPKAAAEFADPDELRRIRAKIKKKLPGMGCGGKCGGGCK